MPFIPDPGPWGIVIFLALVFFAWMLLRKDKKTGKTAINDFLETVGGASRRMKIGDLKAQLDSANEELSIKRQIAEIQSQLNPPAETRHDGPPGPH